MRPERGRDVEHLPTEAAIGVVDHAPNGPDQSDQQAVPPPLVAWIIFGGLPLRGKYSTE